METPLNDELFLSDNARAALEAEEAADAAARGEGSIVVGAEPAVSTPEGALASGPLRFEIPVSLPAEIRCEDDMAAVLRRHAGWIESVLNPDSAIIGGRANLSGSDLSGFNLAGVDLRGANFSGAVLRGTILSRAILTGANFAGADMQGVDLRGARLRRANLSHADLRDADLAEADLRETVLERSGAVARKQEAEVLAAAVCGLEAGELKAEAPVAEQIQLSDTMSAETASDSLNQ